jgi:hypothetical protein
MNKYGYEKKSTKQYKKFNKLYVVIKYIGYIYIYHFRL